MLKINAQIEAIYVNMYNIYHKIFVKYFSYFITNWDVQGNDWSDHYQTAGLFS